MRSSLGTASPQVVVRNRYDLVVCPQWVTSDKTHVEHNESALTLIADIPGDMDFRSKGPTADSCRCSKKLRSSEPDPTEKEHRDRAPATITTGCPRTCRHSGASSRP
jgi:hypothetical protein